MTEPLDRSVLDDVLGAIEPASAAARADAERRLAAGQVAGGLGRLGELSARLAGARHLVAPPVERKSLVVCAADHGVAGSGPSATAAVVRTLAGGGGVVNVLARAANARLVLVDCGVRGGDQHDLGRGVLPFRIGDGSADFTAGPAMSAEAAISAVQTGIALVLSLASEGLDLLALGQVGDGGPRAAAAMVDALLAGPPDAPGQPLEVLARVGGFDLGVLAGLCLGAAAIHVPVVLDGDATVAAALLACTLCPDLAGYLIAGHASVGTSEQSALAALGLSPVCDLGLTLGAGAGAAIALPVLDAAVRLQRELSPAAAVGLTRR